MAGDQIAHGVVQIEVNDRETLARLNAIRTEFDATMRDIDRMHADAEVGADLSELRDDVANAKRLVRELEGQKATVTLKADKKRLEKQIEEAKALVKELDGETATVEMRVRGEENVIKAQRAIEDAERKRGAAEAKMQRDLDRLADQTYQRNMRRVNQEAKVRESLNRQRFRELRADEAEAYRIQKQRTEGIANEVREVFRLQGEYAKLTDRMERVDKKRPIGREAHAKVELEAASVYAQMEVVKAKLNALGKHPPVEIKADLDRSVLRRTGDFMARLANKASGLQNLTVRLGPFTTSLKGLALGLATLGPLVTDLLGGASALVGVLGAGISGAAAIGTAAVTGFAAGLGGLMFTLQPIKADFKIAQQATLAYTKAVDKYGASSKQAKTAQAQMNSVLKTVNPVAAEAARGLARFQINWGKATKPTQASFGQIVREGFRALDELTPMWSARTNQLSGMLARGLTGAFRFLSGPTGAHLLDTIMGNFNAMIPTVLHGLGNIGHAFLNIGAEGSKYLGMVGRGFDGITNKFLAWTQSDTFGATIKRWVNDARDLMRFFGAAGRVVMHFFGAGSQAGDRFVRDMTRGLDKWDRFLTSAHGRNDIANAMNRAVTGTEKLWAVIAPLGGAFLEWASNLTPFVTGLTQGIAFVSRLVEGITRLVGMTGAIGTLGATIGAIWAVGKVGTFLSLLVRAYEIMKSMAALGLAGGLKSFFGLDGRGGFLGQLKQKTSIAESGAAAAEIMKAEIISGSEIGAAEFRAALATGGAAAATEIGAAEAEGAAAAAAVSKGGVLLPGGAARSVERGAVSETAGVAEAAAGGAVASKAGKAAGVASRAFAALSEMSIAARFGLAGLAIGAGLLAIKLWGAKSASEKAHDAFMKNVSAADAMDSSWHGVGVAVAGTGEALTRSRISVHQAREELAHAKKGTDEYKLAQLDLRDALREHMRLSDQWLSRTGKERQAVADNVKGLKDNVDKLQQEIKTEKDRGASAARLAILNGKLRDSQLRYNDALARQAALEPEIKRQYRGMAQLSTEAEAALGRLIRKTGSKKLGVTIALKYESPSDVRNVAMGASQAIKNGVSIKTVMKIVADSRDAEDALKRLQRAQVTSKTLHIVQNGGPEALALVKRLAGAKLTPKQQRIIENGGENALALLHRIVGTKLTDKIMRAVAKDEASGVLARILGLVDSIPSSRTSTITVNHVERFITVGGKHVAGAASGHAPGPGKMALVGEGGAHEWGVNTRTGNVARFNGPTFAKLGRHDAIIPTEPRYRSRGRDIFKMIARDLGIEMHAAGRAAKKKKPKLPSALDAPSARPKFKGIHLSQHGKHVAVGHAERKLKLSEKKVPNYNKIPEVEEVNRLTDKKNAQGAYIEIAQSRLTEPSSFIKVVGEDVEGNDIYGVDQAAVDGYVAQYTALRDLYAELMQIIHDLAVAVQAAIPAVQKTIRTAEHDLATIHHLEHLENAIIDAPQKRATASQRDAAKARLGVYQAEDKRLNTVITEGHSSLGGLREQLKPPGLPQEYEDAQTSYNDQQAIINAAQSNAQSAADAAQTPLPDLPDPADLAIAKAESTGDVAGQIAGYNQKIAEAQAALNDNNPYNDLQAYNDITSSNQAIASLQDQSSGASGGSTDSTPFAAQLMNLSSARSDLYKNFGANFALASNFAAASRTPVGQGAFGYSPVAQSSSAGPSTVNNIVNNYAAPPPDPHTWSKNLAWELQASV